MNDVFRKKDVPLSFLVVALYFVAGMKERITYKGCSKIEYKIDNHYQNLES